VKDRLVLSDAAGRGWRRVIGRPDQKGSTGRTNRILWKVCWWIVHTGLSRRDLPERSGNWNSVFRRFSRWSIKGVCRASSRRFDDPDFRYLIVDFHHRPSSSARGRGEKRGYEDQRSALALGLSTRYIWPCELGCPVRSC